MIISGGFNIYPSDLEAVLREHAGGGRRRGGRRAVDAVGRDAGRLRRAGGAGDPTDADALKHWVNQRVGKTQRLADLHFIDELPRSAIGKVLKRELRDRYVADSAR